MHRGAIRKEVQVHVKFSSMQASSASLPIRSPRFSLPDRRPTRDERRGTRAAEQSALASNPLCPPRVAEPRRGEVAKTKRWSLGCREGCGARRGARRVGQGEEGGVSSPQLAIKNLFRGERLHTIRLAKRERRKEGILFFLLLLLFLFSDKDEEKSFKKLLVASQRQG